MSKYRLGFDNATVWRGKADSLKAGEIVGRVQWTGDGWLPKIFGSPFTDELDIVLDIVSAKDQAVQMIIDRDIQERRNVKAKD